MAGIASAPPTLLAPTPYAHLTSSHSPPGFFSVAWSLDAPSSIAAFNVACFAVVGGVLSFARCGGFAGGKFLMRAMEPLVFTLDWCVG